MRVRRVLRQGGLGLEGLLVELDRRGMAILVLLAQAGHLQQFRGRGRLLAFQDEGQALVQGVHLATLLELVQD